MVERGEARREEGKRECVIYFGTGPEAMGQPKVHPRAIVDPRAILHDDVEIGPGAVIEAEVELGAGTRVIGNAFIYSGTTLGEGCEVHPGAVLGGAPQDHHFKGERSLLAIGRRNIFRECVTVSRATGAGERTVIGDRNMFLNYAHIGHNTTIGSDCVVEGAVMIAGHVTLGDRALLAGLAGVHQFCRVGRLAMIGFAGGISQDLPPFMTAVGTRPFYVMGPNVIGLRRAGIGAAGRAAVKRAYKLLCRSGLPLAEVLVELDKDETAEVREIVAFVRGSKKGIIRRGAARGPRAESEPAET